LFNYYRLTIKLNKNEFGNELSEQLGKLVIVGAIAGVVSYIFLDGAGQIQVFGNFVPGWVLIGIVVAVADGIGTFFIQFVSSYLVSGNKTVQQLEDALLISALCSLSTWLILDPVLGIGKLPMWLSQLVGSSLVADYIYKNFIY
jgi:hypothetical protein